MPGGPTPARTLTIASFALTLAVLALLPDRAAAASGWQIVLDRPTPSFGAVDFVSDSEGWMPAGAGLLHTTDGGATWEENAKLTVNDVDFFDQQHGWAGGYSGEIFATMNGGDTWQVQASGLSAIEDIVAVGATEAWAVTQTQYSDVPLFPTSALLHTTDSGSNWGKVELPLEGAFEELEVTGDSAWIIGEFCDRVCNFGETTGGTLQSRDGGATWAIADALPDYAAQIDFVDNLHGWLVSYGCAPTLCPTTDGNTIHQTEDGGLTWTSVGATPSGVARDMRFVNTNNGAIALSSCDDVRCRSALFATTDGGAAWRELYSVTSQFYPQRLYVSPHDTIFLTGTERANRFSVAGLEQAMSTPALTLGYFDFIDQQTGFALDGSTLIHTQDAGRSWERRGSIESQGRLQALQFFDDARGTAIFYGCNQDCRIDPFQTDDGGWTWSNSISLPHTPGFQFKTLQLGANGAGVAAAYRGLAVTTDYGATWQAVDVPIETGHVLNGAAMLDATHLWADSYPEAGGPSILWFSSDAGEMWDEVYSGLPLGDIEFFDALHGWARALEAYYRTSDGGRTWTHVDTPLSNRLFEMIFVDPDTGWASGSTPNEGPSSYRIFHTEDAGQTWSEQRFDALDNDVATGLDFVDARTGWFTTTPSCAFGVGCGFLQHRTVLYHTTDGGGGTMLPDVGAPLPAAGRGWGWGLPLLLGALATVALAASFAFRRERDRA